jgi:hypothetical protein
VCLQRQGAGAPLAYRIFFLEVRPEDLTRLLWVVMGAAAIGTNAGSTLLLSDTRSPSSKRCGRSSMA